MSRANLCRWSIRSTSARPRKMPPEDLLDQVIAEPPGQWTRAQQEAVVNRAEDRVVHQFWLCLRPQLACIFAALQIGERRIPPGTDPSVKELLKDGWLALALGDYPGHDLAEGPVERIDQPPRPKAQRFIRGQLRRPVQVGRHSLAEHGQH